MAKRKPQDKAIRSRANGAGPAKRTRAKAGSGAKQATSKAAASKQASKKRAQNKQATTKPAAKKQATTKPAAKKQAKKKQAATKAVSAKATRAGARDAAAAKTLTSAQAKREKKAGPVAKTTDLAARKAQQASNAELWARYAQQRSPELREELILQYAPLVKYVIGRLAISLPAIIDYEDILSYGTIGLIEAVERFDHEKGVKFETYAISRIRGAIIDALRSLDRLPRSVRQKAKSADAAIQQLVSTLGRDPTDQEVADVLEIPLERYLKDIVDASWVTVSLDTVGAIDADDDGPAEIPVADPEADEFPEALEQEELVRDLTSAIGDLPEREQLVLSLYYKEELTMREISTVLGVSESRVCQLHARSLGRLRVGLTERQARGEAA